MKAILASLMGLSSDRTVLDTAGVVARLFSAHVDCLHVRLDVPSMVQLASSGAFSRSFVVDRHIATLEKEAAERSTHAHSSFEEFRKHELIPIATTPDGQSGPSIAWQEITGLDFDDTVMQARIHDLTILSRDEYHDVVAPDRAGNILLNCGRPVLIAPHKSPKSLSGNIVIAWKSTADAARAVDAAMPFLEKAKNILVFAVGSGGADTQRAQTSAQTLSDQLVWHGVRPETRVIQKDKKTTADCIRETAYELDADLLVMGAYGHSRAREILFGGVTRGILKDCSLPVLLAH